MLDNVILQVYDGLESNTRCPHHSSRYPDFCMSAIKVAIYNNIYYKIISTIISMISTISTYLGGARGPGARGRVCCGDWTRVHGGAHQQRRQGRGGGGRGSGGVSLIKHFHEPTLHQYLLPQNHVISSERREVTRDTCQTGTRATRSSWWRRLGTARGYTPSPRASRCVSTISTQYL